jgi:hypothetical protein
VLSSPETHLPVSITFKALNLLHCWLEICFPENVSEKAQKTNKEGRETKQGYFSNLI